MNVFEPFTTYSPLSRRANVFRPATSEPAPGSVIASAPIFSPLIPGTSQRCFCSSVPNLRIGGIAIPAWPPIPAATPPEPQRAISSANTAPCTVSPPWPPYSSG